MLHIIWSVILGFVAGAIAYAMMGTHTPMGFLNTTLLCIVGSIVGVLNARWFSKPSEGSWFHPAGLILSIAGAIIALLILGKIHP